MSENQNTYTENGSNEHHSSHHHGEHHGHHSENHGEHHHSSGHSRHGHSSGHGSHHHGHHSSRRSSRSRSKSKGLKAFLSRIAHKLNPRKTSSHKKLKKLATASKNDKRNEYAIISKRVLFGVLVLGLTIYTAYTLGNEDADVDLINASTTPSENSQLKIQLMQLQQENEELQSKLDKYIALYGELEEDAENKTK